MTKEEEFVSEYLKLVRVHSRSISPARDCLNTRDNSGYPESLKEQWELITYKGNTVPRWLEIELDNQAITAAKNALKAVEKFKMLLVMVK